MDKRTKKFLKLSKSSDTSIKNMKKGRKKAKGLSEEDQLVETDLGVDSVIAMPPKSKSKGAIQKHREEIESLKQTDPEFFNFLQKNDAQALQFGDGEDGEDDFSDPELDGGEEEGEEGEGEEEGLLEGEGEGDEGEGEAGGEEGADDGEGEGHSRESIEVTQKMLKKVVSNAVKGSFAATKKMVSMLKAACVPDSDAQPEGDDDDDQAGTSASGSRNQFVVSSPEIYNEVMVSVLENGSKAFRTLLGLQTKTSSEAISDAAVLTAHPKWKKIQIVLLSFFKSVMHTLSGLASSASKDGGQVAIYLVDCLEDYVPLLAAMPRLSRSLLKTLLSLWIIQTSPSQQKEVGHLAAHAFLRIRQMAIVLPGATAEECFRSLYLTYARVCKTFNEMSASSTLFMAECVAVLYSGDVTTAYQQAFLYIRQLALHLRTAVLKASADSLKQIVSWQYLNCIRLWTKVVSALPSTAELGDLAFPLIQIIFGVMGAVPSVYNLPLKFHLITCLHQIAASCKVYIPVSSKIFEALDHLELVSKPTPSTELAPRLQFIIKFPTDSVNRVVVRDLIVQECITLLQNDAEIYRYHVGFPEYAYTIIRKLRAFAKKTKISKWRDLSRTLASQLEETSLSVKKGRVALGQVPSNVTDFEPLLPSGGPDSATRLWKKIAPRFVISEMSTSRVTIKNARGGGGGYEDDGDDDEDSEGASGPKRGTKRAQEKSKGKTKGRHDDDEDEDEDDYSDEEDEEDEQAAKEAARKQNRAKKNKKKKTEPIDIRSLADVKDTVGELDWSGSESD